MMIARGIGKVTDKMPMRAIKRRFKSKKDTEYLTAALDMLQENDWLTIEIVKTKGRSSTVLSLNPVFTTPNQSVPEVLPTTPPKQPIEKTQKTVTKGTKVSSDTDKAMIINEIDNNTTNIHVVPKGNQFVPKDDFTLCQKIDSECQKIDGGDWVDDDIDTQPTNPPQVIQANNNQHGNNLSRGEIDDLISKVPAEQRYELRQEFERQQKKTKQKAVEWLLGVVETSLD